MEPIVKVGGLGRRMLDFFLLRVGCWPACRALASRRLRRDFLWARVRERRSVARIEALTSGEGGSPKMKNLMKAAMRRTIESWPRMKPWVKESLGGRNSESAKLS